jgi:hypothetical protein
MSIVDKINLIVRDKEKDYGYSHPKYFKSQSEYNEIVKKVDQQFIKF